MRAESGYKALACAIIEQAVEDVKTLKAEGYILPGGVARSGKTWKRVPGPNDRVMNRPVVGIKFPHQIEELLCWMRGDSGKLPFKVLLDCSGLELTQRQICTALGIWRPAGEGQEVAK